MGKLSSYTTNTAPTVNDKLVSLSTTPTNQNIKAGDVAALNPYCFRAYAGSATTLTDATIVQITLNTESYDYNSNFASSAYTAPYAGVYHFDGAFAIDGAVSTGVYGQAYIYVNGVEAIEGGAYVPISSGVHSVSGDLLLAAGDVVTFRGYQNSAGNEATRTGSLYTYFSGHLVHRVF